MTDKGVPRFVKVIAIVVVVGFIAAFCIALWISNERKAAREDDCERSVQFRADTRAMWVWLGDQFPQGAQEVGLQEKLDELVPELTCVDGTLTPVRPQ